MMIHNGRKKLVVADNFKCINKSHTLGFKGDSLVTIEFYETSLREALFELGAASGASIFPDNSVSGTVTANFKNMTVKQILDNLLAIGNYIYKVFPNYILVGAGDKENPGFNILADTCVFMPAHGMSIESTRHLYALYLH